MSKFKSQGFFNTFKNARRGMRLALKSEDNIKIHLIVALLVLVAAFLLKFSAVKFCIIFLTIAMVIVAEMINSGIEYGLDAVFHNRYSKLVGMAKDIAAGAVMFATITSIIIGVILFGESLIALYGHQLFERLLAQF